jgi:hypothetical protein
MTQTEYAKHRGVSQPYINRLVKQGKIPLADGKIDPETADAALDAAADPSKGGVRASNAERRQTRPDAPAAPPEPGAPIGQFNRAKTVDATFVAKLRELEYKKQIGALIEREPYAKANEDAGAMLRKELDAMQHRLAPLVAGESSIQRCRELIAVEVDRACAMIADTLEALAADPRSGTRQ